jgi:hypothetical protein
MKVVTHHRSWLILSVLLALLICGGWSADVALAGDIDFTQCLNDAGNANAIDTCTWANGAINQINSYYNEGNSVPQRLFHNIDTAGTHTIRLSYDFTKADIYAYDFLSTPDLTQSGALLNQCGNLPTFVTSATCSSLFSSKNLVPIPSDLFDGVSSREYPTIRNFFASCSPACTGGSFSISNITHVPSTVCTGNCDDSSVTIDITFQTASANTLVALWFGAHLAVAPDPDGSVGDPIGWGTGNGASSIQGSPFHVKYALFDGSSVGKRDNQMSAGGVVDLCGALACNATDLCSSAVCIDGACVLSPKNPGVECRAASDVCDVAEYCDGLRTSCPDDGFKPATEVCRGATGVCDVAESCTGSSAACPADSKAQAGISCNDGNACTQTDQCDGSGACVGSNSIVCTASDQCHVAGVCNTTTGVCTNPNASNGSACSDGNACTQSDTCQAGVCTGSNPVTCSASDQCHDAGTCDPANGTCSNPNASNGSACSDGNACTQSDTCQSGTCVGSNPIVCAAPDQCHDAGVCNTSTGSCSYAAQNGTTCNDGNACTNGDYCVAGVCTGHTSTVSCTALDQCHLAGTCNPASGACSNPNAPGGTVCGDQSSGLCNDPDFCDGSGNCDSRYWDAGTFCREGDGVCNPDDVCNDKGQCPDKVFDPTLLTCQNVQVLICRTAGFWSTHAGEEKKNGKSQNITLQVIDATDGGLVSLGKDVINKYGYAGKLSICGENIVNTQKDDEASALEALCVSIKGNQRLQLVRQLTAAALNCVISGGSGDCSTVPAYADVFSACNTTCTQNTAQDANTYGYCIAALDCLNNGGDYDSVNNFCRTGNCSDNDATCNDGNKSQCTNPSTATCVARVGTCHEQPLCPVNFPGFCFTETGPAGSTDACNTATGNKCTVVSKASGYGPEDSTTTCSVDSAP